jgi:putative transcriptional regulator
MMVAPAFFASFGLVHAVRDATLVRNSLRDLRARRHWSQGDLAEQLGVSRQSINAIETGRYDPSLPLAFRIAHLFGRRIEDVFEDDATGAETG